MKLFKKQKPIKTIHRIMARKAVYYEVLDTIKDDIIMGDLDPADYGLGMNLEKRYLQS